MKQLVLDSNEAFDFYTIALTAVWYYKKEVERDYNLNISKESCKADEKRLKVAKKLLDFARETSKGYLITEIEMPF